MGNTNTTKRQLRKMSSAGDEVVCEWDTAKLDQTKLDAIESEYRSLVAEGYFSANLDTQELIREFDPQANILMIPRMVGG